VPELPLVVDFCATHTNFEPTLVHLSVDFPVLAVTPALVHLPPALLAALTFDRETDTTTALVNTTNTKKRW
jgi:hypothetical protein